jgi:hypothetical protein
MENQFFVDSQHLSPEALEKKHRLENEPSFRKNHMEYMPGMEIIESDVCKSVMAQMNSYDYSEYTADDVKAALEHNACTIEDFKALLSPAAEPFLEQMAERATKANEVAVAYVNDATPSIYSLNRNHEAYVIEKLGYDMVGGGDFTLLNESSVRRLMVTDPDVMPYYPKERAIARGIDLDYGQKYIKKHVTSGILQGKSVYKIADDLQKDLTNMERASAIRTARTAVTSAQNGGRQDSMNAAAKMGIKLRKRWVSAKDMRVRDAHGKADGQTVNIDEPFIVGGEKLMFPGDTSSASGRNIYNCRCGMRTVEKKGIEAEQRQVRVRNPEWEKAHEDEEKAKAKYERALEKEKAETDPEKKKELRKARLEKQHEYERYSEIRKGTQKNIVVNGDMTYTEWLKLRGG